MRCTLPPAAGTLSEAGGPRGPKPFGGRFLPRRRAGGGVVGGEKYSSLELDATAAAGDTGDPGSGGGEAELSDDSGVGRRAYRLVADLVIISLSYPVIIPFIHICQLTFVRCHIVIFSSFGI